jgi:hypothetical protein
MALGPRVSAYTATPMYIASEATTKPLLIKKRRNAARSGSRVVAAALLKCYSIFD